MRWILGVLNLVQVIFNVFTLLALVTIWRRLLKPAKDDPRLSRGLQILQSKIAILEDLSDRTDVQVKQLSSLLDQKAHDVQEKVFLADRHIQMIKKSMEQSLEVAKIFEDRIPHQEIIERQNTKKYVQAARLAHEGHSVDEIANLVDIPRGELEFIVKVNRENLMFSQEDLPPWALEEPQATGGDTASNQEAVRMPIADASFRVEPAVSLEMPPANRSLKSLGDEFRKAQFQKDQSAGPTLPATDEIAPLMNKLASTKIFQKAAQVLDGNKSPQPPQVPDVRPFDFKKININDTLG